MKLVEACDHRVELVVRQGRADSFVSTLRLLLGLADKSYSCLSGSFAWKRAKCFCWDLRVTQQWVRNAKRKSCHLKLELSFRPTLFSTPGGPCQRTQNASSNLPLKLLDSTNDPTPISHQVVLAKHLPVQIGWDHISKLWACCASKCASFSTSYWGARTVADPTWANIWFSCDHGSLFSWGGWRSQITTASTTQEPTGSSGWSATSSSLSGRTSRSCEWSRSYQAHSCLFSVLANPSLTHTGSWAEKDWAPGLIEVWNILVQRHSRSLLKTGRYIMKFLPLQVLESFPLAIPVEKIRLSWGSKNCSTGFQDSRAHLLKRMHGAPSRPQSSFDVSILHLSCEKGWKASQHRSSSKLFDERVSN